ncbi:hypothetical protein GCM10011316_18610 [Roseibium aquae]|uniref:CENP-V/GFA domain-containing protein n=1 Tax=Roseibium aquae TaxID=1323746 RepID=A0A916X122_9HYPH|nr:hypothetical protein [Roseibium aquae]GGB46784.1 hypothetical protein GCM10011316_18610 [Roseibium aquae]
MSSHSGGVTPPGRQEISCACGATRFVCTGKPIMVTECYCDSCRKAGGILAALPCAEPVLEASSGTLFVLHRKDRIVPVSGTEHLRELRLTPASSTRRVVAICCNSPMFLDFSHGHRFSAYAERFPADQRPVVEERTMLADMPQGFRPPSDARNSRQWSANFMGRLFWAWARMGFRTPENDWVKAPLT